MERFHYQLLLKGGQRTDGTVKALSRREAIRQLLRDGRHPLFVTPADEAATGAMARGLRFFRRVKTSDLAVFTRQLATLLKAGLSMVRALQTLRQQTANRALVKTLQEIEESVSHHGVTLADALEDHTWIFDPVYRGVVRAGEEGGSLVEVLAGLADHLARSAKLRGQVIGAFVYPMFLLVLGSAAIFILMTFVIPRFQEIFAGFGQNLPLATQVLIAVSTFLAHWWWALLCGIGGGILLLLAMLRRQAPRQAVDGYLLRLPVLGTMYMKLEVSRITQTLASLLRSGLPMLETLRITGDTVRNQAIKAVFPAMINGVTHGQTLADAVNDTETFPVLTVNMIRTGEDAGELVRMLGELADVYEEEASRAVTGAVKLLEPTLIVLMGLVISGIVAAVMLPIFQTNAIVK